MAAKKNTQRAHHAAPEEGAFDPPASLSVMPHLLACPSEPLTSVGPHASLSKRLVERHFLMADSAVDANTRAASALASTYFVARDVEIPMRDGVVLRADVWAPSSG